MLKRAFDLIFGLFFLILLSPLLVVIAVLIYVESPGPVIYRGVRAGLGGEPFKILKFRSMVVDAEKVGGGTTALGDPRITRTGRFLRKLKLDELPQLINVITGEMSIVGPRPELLQYTQQYSEAEKCILSVRPGITDLSSIEFSSLDQVVGAVDADRVFEEKVLKRKNELRVKYAREHSFWLDLVIIFRTATKLAGKALGR